MESQLHELQVQISYQENVIQKMSSVVYQQQEKIEELSRAITQLKEEFKEALSQSEEEHIEDAEIL